MAKWFGSVRKQSQERIVSLFFTFLQNVFNSLHYTSYKTIRLQIQWRACHISRYMPYDSTNSWNCLELHCNSLSVTSWEGTPCLEKMLLKRLMIAWQVGAGKLSDDWKFAICTGLLLTSTNFSCFQIDQND